jgi:glycosyltransferase involved in cell wall biosynthesis
MKISVIIPTLNEEKYIPHVISNIPRNFADEIIVVDGFSSDDTITKARQAGADKIIYQNGEGKGSALRTGVEQATGDILIFWDADIRSTQKWMFPTITKPILENNIDFVKVNYSKTPGRVACLMAIPMLKKIFPELAEFGQPLSGEVAFKRPVLENINIEPHFGAEVGMLIDITMKGHKTEQVDLKTKKHKHHPVKKLTTMSEQIMETIINRAKKYNRLDNVF